MTTSLGRIDLGAFLYCPVHPLGSLFPHGANWRTRKRIIELRLTIQSFICLYHLIVLLGDLFNAMVKALHRCGHE